MKRLSGPFAVLMTPFEGEDVDESAYAAQIKRLNDTKIAGYVTNGSTSEFIHLPLEQQTYLSALTAQLKSEDKKLVVSASINAAEFRKIEHSIEKWIKQKKFSEYDKSRDEVAKELNTTKEYLHLYFTTQKGVDFKTWRTQLRIEEAKRLLLENKELSTNMIGEISGFSDRSNFHRQFVRFVGCSPKQWRDSNGKPGTV